MRREFSRCLYSTGFTAIPAILIAALLVAAGLVLQVIYWLDLAGQEGRIGEFLVLLLVNQLAPVITALIILGRSGAVMLDEVAQMRSSGQINLLHSHGIDPIYLITIPRCSATVLSAFLLTLIFMDTALWGGFIVATFSGLSNISPLDFFEQVLGNMGVKDHLLLLIKPLLMGYTVAYVAIWFGLRVARPNGSAREQLPTAFVITLVATFTISGVLALL